MREICESINSRRCLVSAIETSVYVGKPCIACISGVFYRARVEEITDKKPRDIKVYMMDIGRTENLSLGSLFKLSSVSLLSIPPQAIACKLSTNLSESNDATISTYRSGSIINSTSDIQSSEVSSTSNESICDSSKMNSFSYKSPSPIPAKDINDNLDIKSVSSASAHSNTSQCNISSESPHKSEIQTGTLIPVKVERVTSPFHFIVVHLQDLPKRETLRKAMTEFYQSVPAHANIQANLIVTGAVY
uniref:Tudor domain-containing protein n=1 Tax=Ciona savignyi TaxID=51511 RepID=H2YP00_CIOSA